MPNTPEAKRMSLAEAQAADAIEWGTSGSRPKLIDFLIAQAEEEAEATKAAGNL